MRFLFWSELVKHHGVPQKGGAESTYWQMDETTGIKVIRTPFRLPNGEGLAHHSTQDALQTSSKWREAERQFDLMKTLAKRRRCPTPIEIAIVCDDRAVNAMGHNFFYPAIIMEHIEYQAYSYNAHPKRSKAVWKFINLMEKIVTLCDTHGDNIVYSNKTKRFMVLDLGGVDKK